MTAIIKHDDLDELRKKRIRIPNYFQQGSWVAFPIGVQGNPNLGPSATRLLLWLPVEVDSSPEENPELTKILGASQKQGTRSVLTRALDVLVSADELERVNKGSNGNPADSKAVIAGVEYSAQPFENIFWKHGWVLGTDKGLLVSLLNN